MEREVKLKNFISYGVGDIFGGGSFLLVSTLLLFFLTDIVGITPGQAGMVLLLGKLWDGISDPLMGYISDRTKSRYGRRRLYFLIGIIPIIVSFLCLWMKADFMPAESRWIWYLFAYILFSTSFTLVMVPYVALNAEMSNDYKVRTKLSAFKQLFSAIGLMISGPVPMVIINSFEDITRGYAVMGIIYGFIFALPWIIVFFGTWELPRVSTETEKQSLRMFYTNFLSVFKNKSFRIHLGLYISAYSAIDVLMALFLYYLTHYMLQAENYSILIGMLVLFQILALPLYVKLSNTLGKGKAYIVGMVVWMAGLLIVSSFTPETPLILLIGGVILIGCGLSAGAMIPWAILPSITDVDELITTQKRAGTYAGMMTIFRKLIQAVVIFLVARGLIMIGYDPSKAAMDPSTIQGLRMLFMTFPLFFIVAGIIIASRFKITPEKHQIMMKEIERLKEGGARDKVDNETKSICEELTGIKYNDLYKAS